MSFFIKSSVVRRSLSASGGQRVPRKYIATHSVCIGFELVFGFITLASMHVSCWISAGIITGTSTTGCTIGC